MSDSASTQNQFASGGGCQANPDFILNPVTATAAAGTTLLLQEGQSNSLITIPALSAAQKIYIPSATGPQGISYTFTASGTLGQICTIAPTGANMTQIYGLLMNTTASGGMTGTAKAAAASVAMSATTVTGDSVSFQSDGSKWYVKGVSAVPASLS